jgi:hydroxymethylbilane synthase
MERKYRIGTRTSTLALKQVEEILDKLWKLYPDLKADIVGIETCGDKDRNTPISDIEGSDFFTREIDEALLKGDIDFAVHSAKDLPDKVRKGLSVSAITQAIDSHDALVSKEGLKLGELPLAARIGTSSSRRKEQLKAYRSDFEIVDIRGNTEERLELLDQELQDLDAIIIAACALVRLGLEDKITERIPFHILKPHPLQGALAIETRKDDFSLLEMLSKIDTRKTAEIWA